MVTAISSSCCLTTHISKSEPELGQLSNSSLSTSGRCSQSSRAILVSSERSRSFYGRTGASRPRGCRESNYSGYANERASTVRAVLAESGSKMVDHNRSKHDGDKVRAASFSAAGTTSLTPTDSGMGLVDSALESTLEHTIWLGFGTSATVGMVLKAVLAAHSFTDEAGIAFAAIAAYTLADLGTGIYHWGIDNYGDNKTPIFGSQIDAFQGHHKRPWTITKREFANNTQAIARPVGFFLLPFLILPSNPACDSFLGFFLGLVIMSQQFHAWAHSKESQLPALVSFLQDKGILISRKMHGAHHRAPYSINYCIVSGLWNPILTKSKFFPRLEAAIYSRWGVAPRCWADTVAGEWVQEGSYFEDGSGFKLDREV